MTQEEKIQFISEVVRCNFKNDYSGPAILYKYRPFDEHTFDMIENDYVYLCPAAEEDDETECLTTLNLNEIIEKDTGNVSKEYLKKLIESLKSITADEDYENVKKKVLNICTNGEIEYSQLNNGIKRLLQEMTPDDVDISKIVEMIDNASIIFNNEVLSSKLERIINFTLDAREKIGICALSETSDNEEMWEKYAVNSSGYCIEYDLSNYQYGNYVLPVIYQDERETNIIMQFSATILGLFICSITNGLIPADTSHFIRLFLTKYKIWEYQKEWRLLGDAGNTPKSPRIKAVYIGKNASIDDERRMMECANLNGFEIIKKQ